jgi:LuxR family transcriptional regulator, maltose regulon positive regulatory protein
LPGSARSASPWLGFWRGMCRLRVNPPESRRHLEPAFEAFRESDDTLGQTLAAVAIIESHMAEWVDYRRLDPWIALLDGLLNRADRLVPTANTELAVRASLFTAIVYRQTYRQDIPLLARQLCDLLRGGTWIPTTNCWLHAVFLRMERTVVTSF